MSSSTVYNYDTALCVKAIRQLRETGLFEEGVFDYPSPSNACWEICVDWGTTLMPPVPHDVYWTPNKAAAAVGHTSKYLQHLCKNGKVKCYWYGGYIIPPASMIELRERFLARKHE